MRTDELEGQAKGDLQTLGSEYANINTFVQTCVDNTAKYALFYLGFIGGDITPDPFSEKSATPYFIYDQYYKIPYFYSEGLRLIPGKNNVKPFFIDILETYVNQQLKSCTKKFVSFPNVEVKEEGVKTRIALTDSEAVFNVNYPVYASIAGERKLLGPDYMSRIPVRLDEILGISEAIVTRLEVDDRIIHWDFLTEVSRRDYNITAYTEMEKTLVYRIVDENNDLFNEPYIFQFAVKVS